MCAGLLREQPNLCQTGESLKIIMVIRTVGRLFHCFIPTKEKDDFPNVVLPCGILHFPLIVDLVARAENSELSVTKLPKGGGAAFWMNFKIHKAFKIKWIVFIQDFAVVILTSFFHGF